MVAAKGKVPGKSRWRAWLQLFRLPNCFTVPGEPLAGYFLAAQGGWVQWGGMSRIVAAAVCIYIAGVVWNDYFDRWEDLHKRRARPLPLGLIPPWAALVAGIAWAAAGLGLCWWAGGRSFWIGLLLVAAVFSYNRYLKGILGIGVLSMGLCRGLSILLGASAVPVLYPFSAPVLVAALIVTLYVTAVTRLAKRDDEPHNPGTEIWYPFVVLLIGLFFFLPVVRDGEGWMTGFWLGYGVALAVVLAFGFRLQDFALSANLQKVLERKAAIVEELPRWIGWLIANLLFINVAFLTGAVSRPAGATMAVTLLLCWGANRTLVWWFPPS